MHRVALALYLSVLTSFSSAEEPLAGSLGQADIRQIVGAVLTQKDVAMYLHPEVAGRVPVKVAIDAPYSNIPVDFDLYGQPVKVVAAAAGAVTLVITPTADGALVQVSYRLEGMAGTVLFRKAQRHWKVIRASVYEH